MDQPIEGGFFLTAQLQEGQADPADGGHGTGLDVGGADDAHAKAQMLRADVQPAVLVAPSLNAAGRNEQGANQRQIPGGAVIDRTTQVQLSRDIDRVARRAAPVGRGVRLLGRVSP
ncbi:MAG TPA: hypothetical protein VF157_14300 [Chloroflexota bacterium]